MLLCSLKCLIFYSEIMSFLVKKNKCFQLCKANIDLNRSEFSWMTATDNWLFSSLTKKADGAACSSLPSLSL